MFLLNLRGGATIGEQIQTQIVRLIKAGVLKPGDKLPSVRQLATDNGINPNTVAKAYTELEHKGILTNIPKKGSYVAQGKNEEKEEDALKDLLEPFVKDGMKREEIERVLDELYGGNEGC
jgi:GntR family transcriptional regulator